MSDRSLTEPERKTPILYDVDVAVVGGGTAGTVAAIAAARTGASTVLIEKFGSLGGCPTVGRCTHLGNTFIDKHLKRTMAGIPLEIMDRLVKAGGTTNSNLEELLTGRVKYSNFIIADPEVLAIVLIEMAEEAGVKLMLHTLFCDAIMEEDSVKGVLVQSKAGRQAVLAKTVVDASGEADVALSAGAPCRRGGEYLSSWGLLMRMGNVDVEEFLAYFLSLEAGEPNPEYTEWLSGYLGLSAEELRGDRCWSAYTDPQPVGLGVPTTHPGSQVFTSETQRFFEKKWRTDGYFSYINMHFFRDLLRKAVENGDFELSRKVDGIGEITNHLDGFTSGSWRKGEVVLNAIRAQGAFDAFDIEHITKIEIAARKRVIELTSFLRKYMPGWEDCYIVDTGAITMPRHVCMIEGEYTLDLDDMQEGKEFDDAVFLGASEITKDPSYGRPGFAFQAPYRMMLPKKTENLLVAGKCASGSPYVRAIPSIWAMGQAAGTAAALASRKGVTPRQIGISELQETLREQGAIIDLD
jgi:hypothetical protein